MYDTRVIAVRGTQCALRLAPEQPDCMPYYVSAAFGAGTLWYARGELTRRYPDHAFTSELAVGRSDGSEIVAGVVIHNVHGFPWTYSADATAADYVITVTDPSWLAGIEPGMRFENYAFCELGPFLSPMKPDDHGRPMPWWFPGPNDVRPRDVIYDLDVLEALSAAGIS